MEIIALVFAGIGALAIVAGSLWLLVVAFQESVWWGLGSIFVPFVSLVFVVMHWGDAKRPFLVSLAGLGAAFLALALAPADVSGAALAGSGY